MALHGLDLSDYQASLDLGKLSPKPDFMLHRATLGTDYVDPSCDRHYQQANTLGIKRGVYHFARPKASGAKQQADYFVDNCQGYIGDAIFALDMEKNVSVIWSYTFLRRVKQRIGYNPVIYMNASTEHRLRWKLQAKLGSGLWLASWTKQSPSAKHWSFYFLWQYTSHGHWRGYRDNLDLDYGYLTNHAWDKYAGAARKKPKAQPKPDPDKATIKQLTAQLSEKNQQLKQAQNRFTEANNKLGQQGGTIQELHKRVTSLQDQLDSADDDNAGVKHDLTHAKKQVGLEKDVIAHLRDTISQQKARLAACGSDDVPDVKAALKVLFQALKRWITK